MTTERIDAILQSVSQKVEDLIPSERFYVVLYDQNKDEFSFPLVRHGGNIVSDGKAPWLARPMYLEECLPDWVISTGKSFLVEKGLSAYLQERNIGYWPHDPMPHSWLGVPMIISGQVAGALIVENWATTATLENNDIRLLSTIARQTEIAIENARIKEQLERKIRHLQTLSHVGQQLTKGLAKQEKEILELIVSSISKLDLDTRNISIVFYDPPGSADAPDAISGLLRFVLAIDEGQPVVIPHRRAGNGLTEYVIRTKRTLNPPDVEKLYAEFAEPIISKVPRSWLGVPMISDGQVFGVIVLRNHEFEKIYTRDDQEILEILAGQAAISLLNLRYYEALRKETEQRISVEKTAIMSTMATEFAHKMNNIAGTIPVRVNMAKAELDPNDPKEERIINQLDKIKNEANNLLDAAQVIRESIEIGKSKVPENVNLNELLRTAIAQVKNTQNNSQNNVETSTFFDPDLPLIKVERNTLLDTLTSIIKNGFEAIDTSGTVTITTKLGTLNRTPAIEVRIHDTGKGIMPSELPKIFELFYSTKGDKGLGFGLWRDRVFIKNIGGEIDVESEVNRGSTFIIRIPVDRNNQEIDEK